MADLDRVAVRISDGLRGILRRVGTLALGMAVIAAVVGTATFATGLWIFDGSRPEWIVIGGALSFAPAFAALVAWFMVRRTVKVAPALVGDVRALLDESRGAADVLINYDTGERLTTTAKTFETLRPTLQQRRKQLPSAVRRCARNHERARSGGNRAARHARSRCPRHHPPDRRLDRLSLSCGSEARPRPTLWDAQQLPSRRRNPSRRSPGDRRSGGERRGRSVPAARACSVSPSRHGGGRRRPRSRPLRAMPDSPRTLQSSLSSSSSSRVAWRPLLKRCAGQAHQPPY